MVVAEGRFSGARALASGDDLPLERRGERTTLAAPRLGLYEVVELDYA